jgi:AcrR family transcriptional regulator
VLGSLFAIVRRFYTQAVANRERSNPNERGRHTRLRILAAASELFARHGFDGTTVRMIAR